MDSSLGKSSSFSSSSISSGSLALVIPTWNEADNIGFLLDLVHDALQPTGIPYELIVVDDESTDHTAEVVRNRAQRNPQIRLLTRKGERGLAGAVLYGWAHSDAALLGVMDADLQHPPALLPALLEAALGHVDIAIASRYVGKQGIEGRNPIRAWLSRLSTWATTPFLRKRTVTDPMSGFFMVRRHCIQGIHFQPQGFKLLLEILVRGRIRTVREIPYQFGFRRAGKSKAGAAVGFYYLWLLGRLSREMLFGSGSQ